jgi:hypothetical protein
MSAHDVESEAPSREPPIPPLRGEIVPQHRRPRSRAAARAARPATSSMCASSTPNRYWTMTRGNQRQQLRLRVPVTPRMAAAHTLPFSGTPARIACDASAITRPNHRARHYRTATAHRLSNANSWREHVQQPVAVIRSPRRRARAASAALRDRGPSRSLG